VVIPLPRKNILRQLQNIPRRKPRPHPTMSPLPPLHIRLLLPHPRLALARAPLRRPVRSRPPVRLLRPKRTLLRQLRAHPLPWFLPPVVLPTRLELLTMARPMPSRTYTTASLILVRSLCRPNGTLKSAGSKGPIYPALFAHHCLTLLFACLSSIQSLAVLCWLFPA